MNLKEHLLPCGLNEDTILRLAVLLDRVSTLSDRKENGYVGLSYMELKDTFKRCSQSYTDIKDILLSKVWECDFSYSNYATTLKTYNFKIREEISSILLDDAFKQLVELAKDRKAVTNSKNRNLNKIALPSPSLPKPYHDDRDNGDVLDAKSEFLKHNIMLLAGVDKTEETINAVKKEMEEYKTETNPVIRNSKGFRIYGIISNLIKIYRHSINVEMNSPDGRWHNPYTSLPSEIRNTLTINGKPCRAVLDIRCCHASFFGLYVLTTANMESEPLVNDVKKWNDYFFKGEQHPVKRLAETLGVNYGDTLDNDGNTKEMGLKSALNSYLNSMGHIQNKGTFNYSHKNKKVLTPLHKWIKSNFPVLYLFWLKTDLRTTGNNISLNFETRIMQHPSLFKKANELGVYIGNEHDGISLFGDRVEDAEVIVETIRDITKELFGVNLILSRK